MKIKFIKEYVAVDPATNSGIIHRFGETEEIEKYTAQWLIDNGFAEKVDDEWPMVGEKYYIVGAGGAALRVVWRGDSTDKDCQAIGNIFKTEEATKRCRDYLEAVETVRHDEGFMKYNKTCCEVWELRRMYLDVNGRFTAHKVESEFLHHLGAFYFDTEEHAIASSKKHSNEWQTILNYDWSKGEDDNEED